MRRAAPNHPCCRRCLCRTANTAAAESEVLALELVEPAVPLTWTDGGVRAMLTDSMLAASLPLPVCGCGMGNRRGIAWSGKQRCHQWGINALFKEMATTAAAPAWLCRTLCVCARDSPPQTTLPSGLRSLPSSSRWVAAARTRS